MDPQTKPGAPAAVDVESRVAPGKQTFCPFGAEEVLAAGLALAAHQDPPSPGWPSAGSPAGPSRRFGPWSRSGPRV